MRYDIGMKSWPRRIPLPVWILGIVSLLNDIALEMIAPLVPIFLTTVLRTSIPVVGLIEGVAEATASITKYLFGAWSDRLRRRKPFVVAGYSFGAVSKVLIGLATVWPLVLVARFADRLGKGLRTAARDSILYANTTPQNRGLIFGLHRALDSLGAVIGPLLALAACVIFFLASAKPGNKSAHERSGVFAQSAS